MKEYPILFSGLMVRAILEGRKTMTRLLNRRWMKVKNGDRLWVRETLVRGIEIVPSTPLSLTGHSIQYKATHTGVVYKKGAEIGYCDHAIWQWPGKDTIPSIFMPRWASRITLEATADARLERLQDINEKDLVVVVLSFRTMKQAMEEAEK